MTAEDEITLKRLYRLFNGREIDAILAMLHPDVLWANGQHGGHVRGREGVRTYWTEQWTQIDPTVTPERLRQNEEGTWRVTVRQIVKTPAGDVISDRYVDHHFAFEAGLIRRFDIADPPLD